MDLTNILNNKEAAANSLTSLKADQSQRFQELNRANFYQGDRAPQIHTSQHQSQILQFTYHRRRSPTPTFLASDNVAGSPSSDRSMSSSAYSVQSGPSGDPVPQPTSAMSGPLPAASIDVSSIQRGPGRPSTGDPSSKLFPM